MKEEIDHLVDVLRRAYGRDISLYDESFLAQTLEKRRAAASLETAAAYVGHLAGNEAEAETFFRALNITYSEFFRNPLSFALLEQLVLPGLIEGRASTGRAEIRVWSAGCAAGQEAYSVAMLLDELTGAREKAIPFRIFATDHAEAELAAARKGVYDAAAVQNVRLKHLRRYLTQEGERFVIVPRLGERVDFSAYDLLDERSSSPPASIFGDFDLIICSNLLFYYKPAVRQFILDKVRRSLSPQGYLATGEAEKEIVAQAGGFRAIAPPAAVYQKGEHQWR